MKLGRNFKKAIAIGILSAMVGVMALPVSAATINVTNSTKDKTYTAYKLFDATYSGDKASYTVNTNTEAGQKVYDALRDLTDVFTFTPQDTDAKIYNVTIKDSTVTQKDIVDKIKTKLGSNVTALEAAGTVTGDGGKVTIDNVDNGYYYVTTTNGTIVAIDNANGNVDVIDKNKTPGWEKDPDGGDEAGKTVLDVSTNKYVKANSANIGDTASFKINAAVPSTVKGKNVTEYKFVDTLSTGFSIKDVNNDETVDGKDITIAITADDKTVAGTGTYDLTTTISGNTITVTVLPKSGYPTDAHIEITYQADVNENAVLDNTNTVALTYQTKKTNDVDPEDKPEVPQDKTDTYVYGFDLHKYADSETSSYLAGAEFKLYDSKGNQVKVVAVGTNYKVDEKQTSDTIITTNASGVVKIFGLAEGTYYLEETKAPAGYNKLTSRFEVKALTGDGNGATKLTNVDENGYATGTNEVQVQNNSGTLFPSTGGAGRIALYAVGGVLVVGFSVTMVSRRRSKLAE